MSPSLRKLQIAFKRALLTEEQETLRSCVHQNGFTVSQRIQIYQNNIFLNLTAALKNTYPTICQLTGESFFSTIAKHYIIHYPSTFADINFFGMHFGKFLGVFSATKSFVYLKEIAFLEWAYHEVLHEEEVADFDINKLKIISASGYNQLKFKLNPACRLLAFQHSILPVWQNCQKYDSDKINVENDFNKKEEKILIVRRKLDIFFEKLTKGEFVLLSAFRKGLTFKKAYSVALKSDITFNIENYLKQAILKKVIVDFYF